MQGPEKHLITAGQFPQVDEAIQSLKDKMKLLNYNNLQPPYFLNTLTKFRETHFSKFLKNAKIDGDDLQQIMASLATVRYMVENFDDALFDIYVTHLVEPYTRKMYQENYEFNEVNFKEVHQNYGLQTQIDQTLHQAAEWLAQIEVTQDLLARTSLYFGLKTPHIIEKIRQEGLKSEKNSWMGSIASAFRSLTSFSLRKGSSMMRSTFLTVIGPGALMLSLAIMGGTATLPWKSTFAPEHLLTSAVVAVVPFVLDSFATSIEKSNYQILLKRWALAFEELADSIRKFNGKLQQSIRNCVQAETIQQLQIQRTNLEKIVADLTKSIDLISAYDQQKFQEMRERTEAYFKQYIEIKQGQWVTVISKQEHEQAKATELKNIEAAPQTNHIPASEEEEKDSFAHL